ncbi:MAG: hypothetical protein K8J09_23270, partial [Planctomycetes bacterium]|nr:hypothetical protein [Planctomycetota bacterium]
MCVGEALGPSATSFSVWQPPPTGESAVWNNVEVPPASSTTVVDVSKALGLVGGGGLVAAAGGEFRQTIGVVRTAGFDRSHPFQVLVGYRSYEVDAWRTAGDGVGTLQDPFGPGWRASWGDLLVLPAQDGGPVTRIDEHGVRWVHTRTAPIGQLPPGLVPPPLIYDAQSGTRILRENHVVGGQVEAIWFREWPDRTRLEYGAVVGSGNSLVAKRYYRGDYAAPDWHVAFAYDGSTGELEKITDARGIRHVLTWTTHGSARRVTKISSQAPTGWSTPPIETTFEYGTAAPYQLVRVHKPSRTFLDDQDRSGAYESDETFTGQVVTHFTYSGSSNRIERVYDESTGLARQLLEVTYDSVPQWRVLTMTEGEASSLPGQGPRTQTLSYPQAGRTGWTDARGVARWYDYDTSFGNSPRQWRVLRIEEFSGANDPRPASDPHYHASLVWQFAWACGCGQLAGITLPSGLEQRLTYDTEGRGLVTSLSNVPADQASPPQVRSWTYRSWNESDYRLASRLHSYTDALGRVGQNTYTFDAGYGGYRIDGTFAVVDLFSIQEDATGRVMWAEEASFQVDGGATTSKGRVGYTYGATGTASNQLVTQHVTYAADGVTVYSKQSVTYAGLGWPVTETDALGRTYSFGYDAIGQMTSVTLPTTDSGRGSATYGATITLQYDRRSQVARVARTAHDDQGAAYAHATVVTTQVYDYFGRPWRETSDTSPLGGSASTDTLTTNEYDFGNRLWRVHASGGREARFLYDDHDHLFEHARRLDATTWASEVRGYHQDGVLARAVDPTGLEGTVDTLDAWGRPQRLHLPGDKHVYLIRDDENRLIQSEYRVGVGATLKQTIAFTRDDLGRVLDETLSAPGLATARTMTYTYNGLSRVATVIDGDGRGATYGYDHRGRLVRKQDRLLGATGNAEVFARDVAGNVTRVDHVEQRQTGSSSYVATTYRIDLAYDAWDRLIRGDFFGSAGTVQFSRYRGYNSLGHATWYKDGVGKETRRSFDAAGRKTDEWLHQRNPSLPAVHLGIAYDDAPSDPLLSAILTRTDGVGNASEYRYDLLGRMVERRLAGYGAGGTAKQWLYEYDLAGRLAEWRDGNGTRVQHVRDAEQRLVQRRVIQLPTNGVVLSVMATHETWAYDDFDRVGSAQTWWAAYPQIHGVQPPSLVEAVDAYDGLGRQVLERFCYLDDAGAGYAPLVTKDLVYGFAKPSGGEDAAIRRSMQTSAGFVIGWMPDGAGKLASMTMSGPGIAQQPLADWRYEGGRPIHRGFWSGALSSTKLVAEFDYNAVRHMTRMTTTPSGASSSLYELAMERDPEGNVTQHRYSKASGMAGDWFQLDGWDRLQEAKLGVVSFTGSYTSASVYDKRLAYALDAAHNRENVEEEAGGSTAMTVYAQAGGTNEYDHVTQPNGNEQKWLYDGNGNLLSDGYYLYVYDHLDRLSEAYVLTYPGGATNQSASGLTVQVYGADVQKRRDGKETVVPTTLWRQRVQQARDRVHGARSSAGMAASDPRLPSGTNAGTASTTAAVDEPVPVVVAYYGYDPSNRRIGKLLPDVSGTFYAWSGWEMVEAYDLAFTPTTVWFEGATIDEHLGYAQFDSGTNTWSRYAYLRDHTRGVVGVTNANGVTQEVYEYEPYGRMSVFSAAGSHLGENPTIVGQVYGFCGRQADAETGLQYYRNRYYQPQHGRFISVDPSGEWADAFATGNAYAYVGSAPHSRTDPLGLYTTVIVFTSGKAAEDSALIAAATGECNRDPEGGQVVSVGPNGEMSTQPIPPPP